MTDEQKVRADFEAWLESCYGRIAIGMDREGRYVRDWVNDLWTGWKARDDLSHASATADAKAAAFRNRFVSERTTTWQRNDLDYELARANAEADANAYERGFDQAIAANKETKS